MRILHVVHWTNGGVSKLVQAMVARCSNGSAVALVEDNGGEVRSDISCHILGRGPACISRLRSLVQGLRPDVLHVHSFTPLMLSCATGSVPTVRTVHNTYPYFATDDFRARIKRRLEGKMHRLRNVQLVSVSKSVFEQLPWREPRSTVIENGVDFEAVRRLSESAVDLPPAQQDAITVASLCRLEPQKNVELLIRSFAQCLQSSRSRKPLNLWILGTGSQEETLRALSRSLGLEQHVTFWGHQDNPFPYLKAADIYVSSSMYEGFNLALVEAIGLGLPAASTLSGGVIDSLRPEHDLLIADTHTPTALATQLQRLIDDAELRTRIGENGRRTVLSHYSLDGMLDAYSTVYRTAMNGAFHGR